MKNLILTALAIFFLLGCISNETAYDKSIEINSGSMKTKFGSATAATKNNTLFLKFSSPSLSGIELQNSSFALTTCNATPQDALLDTIQGVKKDYCQENKCILNGISLNNSALKLNATCANEVAAPGKIYVVYLNLSARLKKENSLSILDFRSCDTSRKEYDICSAEYSVVMQKS